VRVPETPAESSGQGDALADLRALLNQQRRAPSAAVGDWNRLADSIRAEWLRLAESPDGREPLLRAAFTDRDRDVRLNAALGVETWDPASAARAFEELVVEAGGAVVRPMTMTTALAVPFDGRDAALCLFNLDNPKGTGGQER
jgi:hypothetical protein